MQFVKKTICLLKTLRNIFVSLILTIAAAIPAFAQGTISISGTVTERGTNTAIEFATVVIEGSGQWAVTDSKGRFTVKNVPGGKQTIVVSCLGYVDDKKEVTLTKDITNYSVALKEDNLALDEAVVTAKEDNGTTTSRTINKAALDQVQVMNVSDVSALLPGGATVNANLTSSNRFNLRAGSAEDGNPSFGTAVEVDGVRLSSNASYGVSLEQYGSQTTTSSPKGAATNNISSSNIASVEVITGVPSVEYGDMTSGVVKINTVKGKTPWTVTFSTNPSTKQVSASKGFGLGNTKKGVSRGVLNANVEYAKSVSNKLSPYNSYNRKILSLTYSNLFSGGALADMPIRLSATISGNLGGFDNKADPDKFSEEYMKTKDDMIRGNISLDWLLNKKWITNIELNGSVVYSNKYQEAQAHYARTTSTLALHGTETGYFMSEYYTQGGPIDVVLLKPGYWNNIMAIDDRPLTAKVTLKGNWSRKFGIVNNKLKVGVDWNADKNFGVGMFSYDIATAHDYREYRYCDKPLMSNVAPYIEENIMIPVGKDGRINLVAGVRNDNTIIPGSAYGTTSSVSPRFNAKYTVFTEKSHRNNFMKSLSFRGSWGVAVKQPSYSILYPEPSYYSKETFRSTADSKNNVYYSYYILPRTIYYNPELVWQKNQQSELGVEMNLGGTKISLAGFYNKTLYAYNLVNDYEKLTYNLTGSVQGLDIPVDNRTYSIDRQTGVVTIGDRTGEKSPITAPYSTRNSFVSKQYATNAETPSYRYGLEWVIDFTRINPINTTIRLDGSFYNYKSTFTNMLPYYPSNDISSDGLPFKYVGLYYGDDDLFNGSGTKKLNANLTITTNIPKARMIIAVKLESCLMHQTEYRSDRTDGKKRTWAISDKNDLLSTTDADIYTDDVYSVTYPDFYYSFDDATRRPFLDDFKAARTLSDQEKAQGIVNGPGAQKYSDLSKLVQSSKTYTYMYHTNRLSPYFCLNLSVTKEIRDFASISFYANNFFNNMMQLYSSRGDQYVSSSSYVPSFYYGLTLRFKF